MAELFFSTACQALRLSRIGGTADPATPAKWEDELVEQGGNSAIPITAMPSSFLNPHWDAPIFLMVLPAAAPSLAPLHATMKKAGTEHRAEFAPEPTEPA